MTEAPATLEAVVLAGGLGTRLRSVVAGLPKPMAPVAGRPFLAIVLAALEARGVTRAVLALGYKADAVRAHFGARCGGIELVYSVEREPLGTGGALRLALAACAGDHALVVNGDTFLDLDLAALRAASNGDPVIAGRALDDTARYGRLLVDAGRVTGFVDKGTAGAGIVNAGHYLLPTDLFAGHALPDRFSFESDFLPADVQRRRYAAFVADGRFIDIGVPEDYARAQALLA